MVKINRPAIEVEMSKKKHLSWRMRIILMLLFILTITLAAFAIYYSHTKKSLDTAKANNAQIEKLEAEKARCNQIISQGQGEFAQYEYCTQLLNTFK